MTVIQDPARYAIETAEHMLTINDDSELKAYVDGCIEQLLDIDDLVVVSRILSTYIRGYSDLDKASYYFFDGRLINKRFNRFVAYSIKKCDVYRKQYEKKRYDTIHHQFSVFGNTQQFTMPELNEDPEFKRLQLFRTPYTVEDFKIDQ